jgi:outer membrane lipoprotein-sorting protein
VITRILLIGIWIYLLSTVCVFAEMSAGEILKAVDDILNIDNSEIEMDMHVFRNNKLRKTYRLNLKYRNWGYMKTETMFPPRDKGQQMLQAGGNLWLYFPKINKTMRVSERNSFSTSDFSNTDLLNGNLSDEYNPTLLGIEDYNGEPTYKLECIAKSEESTYAKIIYWIRKKDLAPLRRDYYTISEHLLKQLIILDKSEIRGTKPDTFIMSSVLEKDKKTVLRYLEYEEGKKFPDSLFTKSSLIKQ